MNPTRAKNRTAVIQVTLALCALVFCTTQRGNAQNRASATVMATATVVSAAPSMLAQAEVESSARLAMGEGRDAARPTMRTAAAQVRAWRETAAGSEVLVRVEFAAN